MGLPRPVTNMPPAPSFPFVKAELLPALAGRRRNSLFAVVVSQPAVECI